MRIEAVKKLAHIDDKIALHPRVRTWATSRDVVEEQTEVPHADVEDAAQLGRQDSAVVGGRIEHRRRGDGEDEADANRSPELSQVTEVGQVVRRIRRTPLVTMIRIQLGTVDVGVQTRSCEKAEQGAALREAVQRTV